jgi:hypothetical protein
VAIHAGPMPNATPVTSEIANANSRTGVEGDALIGTRAKPAKAGNAKWRIRRVHANAIATPAAPPKNESKTLSVRGCLKMREVCAPRATLSAVCGLRSIRFVLLIVCANVANLMLSCYKRPFAKRPGSAPSSLRSQGTRRCPARSPTAVWTGCPPTLPAPQMATDAAKRSSPR